MLYIIYTIFVLIVICKNYLYKHNAYVGYVCTTGRLSREYKHLTDSIRNFPTPQDFMKELEMDARFSTCEVENVFFHTVLIFKCRV